MEYETFKKGMYRMAEAQAEENATCHVDGKRFLLPLEGRTIECVVYCDNPQAPILFCAYGGGFVFGACALDNGLWYTLHQKLGMTVVSIGYRRAPEFPFPSALYDVYDSIEYIESHQTDFGLESTEFYVYGNSAGANLATGVCRLDLQRGNKLGIRKQLLNYPYCDVATEPAKKGHTAEEQFMYRIFPEDYCKAEELLNPLVSPVYSEVEDLKGMPSAVIALAGDDPLLAEGARYAAKLRAAGVDVKVHTADEMVHGYSETWFKNDRQYLAEKVIRQMDDGTMEQKVFETIAFFRKNIL